MDVLSGADSRAAITGRIINVLELEKKYVHVNSIISQLSDMHLMNKSFIRSCLKLLTAEKILVEKGERLQEEYMIVNSNKADINKIIEDNFGETDLPYATKEHYSKYGFEELVTSVAKQVNHDGVVVKEYDIDRLWLSRYIDFLELAKEYNSFRESDNQIALKKARDFRKANKIKK